MYTKLEQILLFTKLQNITGVQRSLGLERRGQIVICRNHIKATTFSRWKDDLVQLKKSYSKQDSL